MTTPGTNELPWHNSLTNMQSHLKRTRTLHLPDVIATAHTQAIIDELNNIDAVTSVELDGSALTIDYNFPEIVFGTIWQIINRQMDTDASGMFTRFRYALIAWMEDNERAHLCAHSGWNRYIQDIYVGHAGEDYIMARQLKKQSQHNIRLTVSHRQSNT